MKYPTIPIGAAFEVCNGATPSTGESRFWGGDVPWIGPADLGKLKSSRITHGKTFITIDGYNSCGTRQVPEGSIILSTRAPIGHIAIAANSLCFNQGCRGLIPRKCIISGYAYWALQAVRPALEAAGQGTTFIELSRGKLRIERISCPNLETQKEIADFLDRETDRIDQLIERKERLIRIIEEKEKAKIFNAVTKGIHNKKLRKTNYFWINETPEYWRLTKLKRALIINNGRDYKDVERESGFPVIGSGGQFAYSRKYLYKGEAVLLGRKGTVDKPLYINGPFWTVDTMFYGIPQKDYFAKFIYYVAKTIPFDFYQTDTALPSMTQLVLNNHIFSSPPCEEQKEIAGYLDLKLSITDNSKALIKQSADKLKEFRSSLITEAVTGQLDIKAWKKRGATNKRLDNIEERITT